MLCDERHGESTYVCSERVRCGLMTKSPVKIYLSETFIMYCKCSLVKRALEKVFLCTVEKMVKAAYAYHGESYNIRYCMCTMHWSKLKSAGVCGEEMW